MKKRLMLPLLVAVLLVGCSTGAAQGIQGRIAEAQRSVGTKLDVAVTKKLQNGEELAIFTYVKGSECGAGLVDMQEIATMSGACTGEISPGQSGNDKLTIVYGFLPRSAGVAKVVLKWLDGTEAEATVTKSAFYYVAEGDKVPQGAVGMTAYDTDGKVVREAAPEQHSH